MKTIVINGVSFSCPFADAIPPPKPEERTALAEDIRQRGIIVPVQIDEHNHVLDGINRLEIAAELGLKDVPVQVKSGLTDEEKRDLTEDLNLHRRHLTREEIRKVLARRLKANPDQSDRAIAGSVGVDNKTVAAVRRELERTEEIPQLAVRCDRRGRKRSATKPARRKAEAPQMAIADTPGKAEADPVPCNGTPEVTHGKIKNPGVAIYRAHEAINELCRIPKNDPLREEGFQLVTTWLENNADDPTWLSNSDPVAPAALTGGEKDWKRVKANVRKLAAKSTKKAELLRRHRYPSTSFREQLRAFAEEVRRLADEIERDL